MSTVAHVSNQLTRSAAVAGAVTLGVLLCLSSARAQVAPPQDEDHGRPVAAVARELGVTPEQFRAAFRKVHPAGRGQEPTQAERQANRRVLSESLGVSPERLDEVMDKYRPGGRGTNGPPRPNGSGDTTRRPRPADARTRAGGPPPQDEDHGRPVAAIARELGVTPEQFRAAFRKVHPAGPGEHPTQAQRQANRKVLSESLGVSPERLDEVMDKYRPGGRGDNGPEHP